MGSWLWTVSKMSCAFDTTQIDGEKDERDLKGLLTKLGFTQNLTAEKMSSTTKGYTHRSILPSFQDKIHHSMPQSLQLQAQKTSRLAETVSSAQYIHNQYYAVTHIKSNGYINMKSSSVQPISKMSATYMYILYQLYCTCSASTVDVLMFLT